MAPDLGVEDWDERGVLQVQDFADLAHRDSTMPSVVVEECDGLVVKPVLDLRVSVAQVRSWVEHGTVGLFALADEPISLLVADAGVDNFGSV